MVQLIREQIVLTLFEVSTISDIMDCHQRRCGYFISDMRWFADSVVRSNQNCAKLGTYMTRISRTTNITFFADWSIDHHQVRLQVLVSNLNTLEQRLERGADEFQVSLLVEKAVGEKDFGDVN